MKPISSKNKKGGVVTSIVLGTIGLIVSVIIGYVIVDTVFNANLFSSSRTWTTLNQTTSSVMNDTTAWTSFGNSSLPGASCSVTFVQNTTGGMVWGSGNYTVDSDRCLIRYRTLGMDPFSNNTLWNITSTTTYDDKIEASARTIQGNLTEGVGNVSSKIPTIMLISAVVLLFGVLVLLIEAYRRMRIGGESGTAGAL